VVRSKGYGVSEPVDESECSLIERLQQGELAAFDGLFVRYRRPLLAYVTMVLKDANLAEDVVQECFVALVRGIDRIDARRGASAWLYRVARNRSIDVLRRRQREVPRDTADPGATLTVQDRGSAPDRALLEKERSAELHAALAGLPDKERDLLALHYFGGLTFREAAQVLGRPLGTVLWQARRSVHKLRLLIDERREV